MEQRKSQLFWLITVTNYANCLLAYITATLLTPSSYGSMRGKSNYVNNPLIFYYPVIHNRI